MNLGVPDRGTTNCATIAAAVSGLAKMSFTSPGAKSAIGIAVSLLRDEAQ